MIFRRLRRAYLAAVLGAFCWAISPAAADERILDYRSEITVQPDGGLLVTETIEVTAEGREIKRGIYRDFPTIYQTRAGSSTTTFKVQSVRRDGQSEPFHTEDRSNGIRLYIGSSDTFVSHGLHEYEITYLTYRQLRHFDEFDELYWNVTGNGWAFPIDQAEALVRLPQGAEIVAADAYTGPQGAKDKDFLTTHPAGYDIGFRTTKPLGAYEGLTVAVSWPPGLVRRPTAAELAGNFFLDNLHIVVGLLGVLLVTGYYVFVWRRVGRDPERGTIIARFAPPDGMSPAAVRHMMKFGADRKAFTAAIINMAVKGYLTINDRKDGYRLEKTGNDAKDLSPGERAAGVRLFSGRSQLDVDKDNHSVFSRAQNSLELQLGRDYGAAYFARNRLYLVPGIVISVIAVLVMIAFAGGAALEAIFTSIFAAFWIGIVARVAVSVFSGFVSGAKNGILSGAAALVLVLFFLPFAIAGIFLVVAVAIDTPFWILIILAALVGTNVVFFKLLEAPTLLGRRVMDDIEGFREYLSVAEGDRMDMLNPPEKTPELFEKYLPYAIALDVENRWAEKFEDVLAAASAAAGEDGYHPRWYNGGSGHHFSATSFSQSLGGGFSSAISSASTAPSSTSSGSGSFGGGSSGGGGGGGGGGGW